MRFVVYLWKRILLAKGVFSSFRTLLADSVLIRFVQSVYARWKEIRQVWRGIWVGVLIALATMLFHDTEGLRRIEDAGLDWMIRMYRGVPRAATTDLRPILFLSIDERSYRRWGEPLNVPRDKLLSLIKYGVEGGAALVIVDVELTRRSGEHDPPLAAYLASLGQQRSSSSDVILVRGLRQPYPDNTGLIEQRSSFLDEALAGNAHLHWASPLYQLDDDGMVRRWRLWEATCVGTVEGSEGQVVVLPSVQLLAAALLKDRDAPSRLQADLKDYLPPSCAQPIPTGHRGERRPYQLGDINFHLNEDDLGRRILYSLPWRLNDGERYPGIAWRGEPHYPLFSVMPAVVVTEAPRETYPDLRGQIVIIGASYADSRDGYPTPLDVMPGAMIMANALLSFHQNGEATESLWLQHALKGVLIIFVAIAFAHLTGFAAKLAASAITLAVLLPISFWLFRSGIWLDFAIPLAAVEIHAMISEFEENNGHRQTLLDA
jgi:CHASE2 domain-containing sensor protein